MKMNLILLPCGFSPRGNFEIASSERRESWKHWPPLRGLPHGLPMDYYSTNYHITFRGKNMIKKKKKNKKHMRSSLYSRSPPGAILVNLLVIWHWEGDYNTNRNCELTLLIKVQTEENQVIGFHQLKVHTLEPFFYKTKLQISFSFISSLLTRSSMGNFGLFPRRKREEQLSVEIEKYRHFTTYQRKNWEMKKTAANIIRKQEKFCKVLAPR